MASSAWRTVTLGEFVRLQRGHDLPKEKQRGGRVPVMGSAGENGFHDKALARGPGVVIGRSGVGSMGVVTYCPVDYWPHNTVLYVTDFLGNDPRFAYYFLKHLNLRQFDSGSAQASLNRNYIYPIDIRIPEPLEQRDIAQILGALDDKIELNRRMNETLEATARALFKSWFVDFEPVRAKVEGRATGLPVEIDDLFPDELVESDVGEAPRGWKVTPLAATINIIGGGTPKRSEPEYWDGDVPWFSVRDVPVASDVFVLATTERITAVGVASSAARVLEPGTTIVTARGTVGKLALVGVPMAMNQSCYGIRSRDAGCDAFTYFRMKQAVTELLQHVHGSVFNTITTDTFSGLRVCVPRVELARQFDVVVGPVVARIKVNVAEAQTLTSLRNNLLPKLLSGERSTAELIDLAGEGGSD